MTKMPVAVRALSALGAASVTFGIVLLTKACKGSQCFERSIAYVFLAWGVVAFLSILPNVVGFACMLASLALGVFLGLVFLFAGRWAGVFPPLILSGIGVSERSAVVSFYLPPVTS